MLKASGNAWFGCFDTLARGSAETYELRPTSQCEKEDVLPFCIGEKAKPQPDMDTFDFSPSLAQKAFDAGRDDVSIRRLQEAGLMQSAATTPGPLFVRVAGPPLFRTVTGNRGLKLRSRHHFEVNLI